MKQHMLMLIIHTAYALSAGIDLSSLLLIQFEDCLGLILQTPEDPASLALANDLVAALSFFNGGKSVQDLFLLRVTQDRIKAHKIVDTTLMIAAQQKSFADYVASNTVNTIQNTADAFRDTAGMVASRVTGGFGFFVDAVDVVTGTVLTGERLVLWTEPMI